MTVALARYALFSGCAVEHAGAPARQATIALAKKLGVELWEAPALGCCGARTDRPADAAALQHLLAPLAEATSQGLAILCLAPGCRQVTASHLQASELHLRSADSGPAQAPHTVDCRQFLAQEDARARVASALTRRLARLRVAVHSTCHGDHVPASAPAQQSSQHSDTPGAADAATGPPARSVAATPGETLAGLVAMTGARLLGEVSIAGRCAETHLLPDLASRQPDAPGCLALAAQAEVDVMVTPCFLCFAGLNGRQQYLDRSDPARSIPVLHLSQMLGLACRVAPQRLELGHLTASARPVLAPLFD